MTSLGRCCIIKKLPWAKEFLNQVHKRSWVFFHSFPPWQLRQLLSESQEQLEAAKTETQKQSKELALVRRVPGRCPAGSLGLACKAAVGPAPFLWAGGGQEGTATAWANLVLLGTSRSQVIAGTQEEIFVCLSFLLMG